MSKEKALSAENFLDLGKRTVEDAGPYKVCAIFDILIVGAFGESPFFVGWRAILESPADDQWSPLRI